MGSQWESCQWLHQALLKAIEAFSILLKIRGILLAWGSGFLCPILNTFGQPLALMLPETLQYFFSIFFFRLWIWCSHSVHPGNTSNTRTRARTGCLTVTVAPPPNNKKTVISSSSKDRMYMDFIHNHCYRSSQDQQNRKKHNALGRLGLIPVRDGVFTALLKPVEEQLCPAVFYRLVSDIIVNDVS